MQPGFIWLLIIFTQPSPIVSSIQHIGSLALHIHYQNVYGVVSNGQNCDSFIFNRLCDIFFEICLTEEGNPKSCNVFFKRTLPTRNTVRVYQPISIDYYTNKKLNLRIKALDRDHFSAADNLGEFLYSFFPNTLSTSKEQRIEEIDRQGAHPTTQMTVFVKKTCAINHFGNECFRCNVSEDRGYCDSSGHSVCYPGYSGPYCSLLNGCQNLTCASFATCQQVGDSFTCFCDDTSGQRCEAGYDPCEEHICEHDRTCVPSGEHLNFAECVNCSSGWGGLHCERKLNVCELETVELGRPPCINGGHCIVNPSNETQFTCLCASGWQGSRCELSFSRASTIVTTISICILILITSSIIAIGCVCRTYVIPKLRLIRKSQKDIEMIQVNEENGNDFSRVNNLYEVTQKQRGSPDISYSAVWKRSCALMKSVPQISNADSDKSDDEYEYETRLDREVMGHSTPAAPELAEQEEDYEPVNYKFLDTLRLEAMSVSCNEQAHITGSNTVTAMKRPLPSTPFEGDNYECLR